MTLCSALALCLLTASPQPPSSPWFGEDKLKHFFASFVVSSLSASAARTAGLDHREGLAVGAGLGAVSGIFKEVQDSRAGGPFSGYDLVWDAAGIGSAVLLLDAGH
ncbi:MAG: DUF2279 domain-containing protein [Gemmatimonas sp.]|nr:DUF2279 domain-containing protein [Gemmatimonas sp.]